MGTPDHKSSNSYSFKEHNFPKLFTQYWRNLPSERSQLLEKVYFNSNDIDDINSFTFQCHNNGTLKLETDNNGLIFTNLDLSPDFDSFRTHTLNDTDDDISSYFNHGSNDLKVLYQDEIMGCCGNSTMMSSTGNIFTNANCLVVPFKLTSFDELVPLGTGRWGDLFIDISFPSNCGFHLDTDRGVINQNDGFDENETRIFLIKMLNDNIPHEIKEIFYQEFSILAQISHKNISRIISSNFDMNPSRQIIISEYSLHGNLHNYLQRMHCSSEFEFSNLTLNIDEPDMFKYHQNLMSIILQLAEALSYLESLHIIHRDVSCRNCLIFSVTDREINIKLIDSAMSEPKYRLYYSRPKNIFQASSISAFHTVSVSAALLPLRWSACETITNNTFSVKSDVFAFGITLWEIYTRCRIYPMSEISDEEVVINSIEVNLNHMEKFPSLILPTSCSKEICHFFKQCIHPNPKARPNFQDICTFIRNNISTVI